MKFTEAKLEQTFIALLENEGFSTFLDRNSIYLFLVSHSLLKYLL